MECTQAKDLDEVSLLSLLKALCSLSSSPSDVSEGRKGLHGRVIKSLSGKETQNDEERKGENPETIFDSDSPAVHTTKGRYGLSDLVKEKAGMSVYQNFVF